MSANVTFKNHKLPAKPKVNLPIGKHFAESNKSNFNGRKITITFPVEIGKTNRTIYKTKYDDQKTSFHTIKENHTKLKEKPFAILIDYKTDILFFCQIIFGKTEIKAINIINLAASLNKKNNTILGFILNPNTT